ncbi:uncharacterized protein LOC115632472 [Scaptodrosophila lebanonensis]|uniref:Uncharacterized protein LOC115632472 n=1 Tax=Drosophila lebanonensis TaxID=7225 RepID=A0A6J2UBR4_DROLE|nr:uncharacterized protein LOC115632472 [Scaptodrosophila lebanonensis]
MFSHPRQAHRGTQTMPQPSPKPDCVPLQMVDEDGKKRYCYHGGRCRCDNCRKVRDQQKDDLDAQLKKFIPHSRLALTPPMHLAEPKQYKLEAHNVSPEMGMQLLKDHLKLREQYPIYYLPDMYFQRNAWKWEGPQEKSTQTDIPLGNFGIDGCPCVDKSQCWDI